MTRRLWFTALLAPFIARFRPKPILPAWYAPAITDLFFRENPLFYRLRQQSFTTAGGTNISEAITYTNEEPWAG